MADFINSFFGKEVRKISKRTKKEESKKRNSKKRTGEGDEIVKPPGSVLYKGYYFINIKKSKEQGKRYDALFVDAKTGREKRISFGVVGEKDFIALQDPLQRDFYDFKWEKKQNWKDLMSRGALQKYILWNKSSLEKSIKDYKRRLKNSTHSKKT